LDFSFQFLQPDLMLQVAQRSFEACGAVGFYQEGQTVCLRKVQRGEHHIRQVAGIFHASDKLHYIIVDKFHQAGVPLELVDHSPL